MINVSSWDFVFLGKMGKKGGGRKGGGEGGKKKRTKERQVQELGLYESKHIRIRSFSWRR